MIYIFSQQMNKGKTVWLVVCIIFILSGAITFSSCLVNRQSESTCGNQTLNLISPLNKSTLTITNPSFTWTPSLEPNVHSMGSYKIEIATDSKFKEIIDQDELAATISWYVPNLLLKYGETYYWRVTPLAADGTEGKPSTPYKFSIIKQPPVYNIPLGSSSESIKSIIEKAAVNTPAIVCFEQGTYHIEPEINSVIIDLENVSDLVIEGAGSGANIISNKAAGFLRTMNCNRIIFKNMTFDLYPLRYTAGKIESIDMENKSIDIKILPDHPMLESDTVLASRNSFILMSTDPPQVSINSSSVDYPYTWTNIDEGRYRLVLDNPSQLCEINIGDAAVIEDRYGADTRFALSVNCEDIVYYNIVGYAGANNGFINNYSDRMRILNSGFTLIPGRLLTLNAGGMNFHDCRLGPWVEGCWFANVGDDGCNANAGAKGVTCQIDSKTLDISLSSSYKDISANPEKAFVTGDRILILDPNTADYIERKVVNSCVNADKTLRVEFDSDVGVIYPGDPTKNSSVSRIINLDRQSSQFVQRFNTYQYIQRNAIITGCTGGLIEGCKVISCGCRAIDSSGPYLPEAWRATDLVIRDLYIEDACLLKLPNNQNDSPVLLRKIGLGKLMNGKGMDWHKNILFDNVRFVNCPTIHYNITCTENYIIGD